MSRYYDYDYDRGCIICFGSDLDAAQPQHENTSPSSSQSADSPPPFSDAHDEDADAVLILEAHPKDIEAKKLKPFLYDDVPFLLVGDLLKRQEQEKEAKQQKETARRRKQSPCGDSLSILHTDKNLLIQRGDYETLQRFDDYNGRFYNTFGSTALHQQRHTWRLQIMGNAPAIIGIVESTAEPETTGAYFGCDTTLKAYSFNTITAEAFSSTDGNQPVYQSLLKCGRLDEPMIIDVALDLVHGTLSIINQTASSAHYGKELVLFDGSIDVDREYKLGMALLGPEVVNLF